VHEIARRGDLFRRPHDPLEKPSPFSDGCGESFRCRDPYFRRRACFFRTRDYFFRTRDCFVRARDYFVRTRDHFFSARAASIASRTFDGDQRSKENERSAGPQACRMPTGSP
jgi:hypothetical protein